MAGRKKGKRSGIRRTGELNGSFGGILRIVSDVGRNLAILFVCLVLIEASGIFLVSSIFRLDVFALIVVITNLAGIFSPA